MRNIVTFLLVGLAFLVLFIPYIAFKTIEHRWRGGLTESEIVSRLGRIALADLFLDEVR